MPFRMSPAICLNLDQYKILSSGNGLKSHPDKNFSKLRTKLDHKGLFSPLSDIDIDMTHDL